jgi:hypothetical protein
MLVAFSPNSGFDGNFKRYVMRAVGDEAKVSKLK